MLLRFTGLLAALAAHAAAAPPQASFPAPLDAALSEAEETPRARYSYTMTFEWQGADPIVARFEVQSRDWTLISGDPSQLPGEARKRFENVKKSESVPGGLLYADFREHLKQVRLIEETGSEAIYRFTPPEAEERDVPEDVDDQVRARLVVDTAQGHLALYEVRALQPVSPYPTASFDRFVVEQAFAPLPDGGPSVLRRLTVEQQGTRFFRDVDVAYTAYFSDFESVASD